MQDFSKALKFFQKSLRLYPSDQVRRASRPFHTYDGVVGMADSSIGTEVAHAMKNRKTLIEEQKFQHLSMTCRSWCCASVGLPCTG